MRTITRASEAYHRIPEHIFRPSKIHDHIIIQSTNIVADIFRYMDKCACAFAIDGSDVGHSRNNIV